MAKLTKRKGKNNWEVQVPLPAELRKIKGTPSIYRSTGTADRKIAKARAAAIEVEAQREIAAMAAKYFPDNENLLEELRQMIRYADGLARECLTSAPMEQNKGNCIRRISGSS